MGCGATHANHSLIEDSRSHPSKFLSYLKSLPKLYASTSTSSIKFLCTCHVIDMNDETEACSSVQTPDESWSHEYNNSQKKMVFACTDMQYGFYEKVFTSEELHEIREVVDVNKTVGWVDFFRAIKYSFLHRKVVIDFKKPGEERDKKSLYYRKNQSTINIANNPTCNFTLELHFPELGRTTLTFLLTKIKPEQTTAHMSDIFLTPLLEFYGEKRDNSSAEKIETLERQVKMLNEKIHLLKDMHNEEERNKSSQKRNDRSNPTVKTDQQNNSLKPANVTSPGTSSNKKDETLEQENLLIDMPKNNILKFLQDLQGQLTSRGALSKTEQISFQSVMELLTQDNVYSFDFKKKAQKEVDLEVLTWLKVRFGVNKDITTTEASTPTHQLNLRGGDDFLSSSNIGASSTRNAILTMFNKVDDWNFDVFTLSELTEGQTLYITSYTLFHKYDLLNKFRINEKILINFLREIEAGYHPNPYHNAMHAADVLQVLHCIIYRGQLGHYMSDENIIAALCSAIIHDYDHPGLNNAFQTHAGTYLALLYNDRSVLENHHCAQAFELMRSPQYNILTKTDNQQRKEIRENIISMVLSTDMSLHSLYIAKFKSRIEQQADFSTTEDLRLSLQIAVKMADVSNPSRTTYLYLKWAERLCDEFYRQGDKERELHLPISPLMDRNKPALAKSQIAFMNYIIYPMFESFCHLLPEMKFALKYINDNRAYWNTHDEIVHRDAAPPNDESPAPSNDNDAPNFAPEDTKNAL
mmetsp:Transcript_5414/g.7977  ORF Transcript_5414/g.7977 Transcript_5414/m.7977 type:complete len:753 (-) Transcript_5414:698-2956(-)